MESLFHYHGIVPLERHMLEIRIEYYHRDSLSIERKNQSESTENSVD